MLKLHHWPHGPVVRQLIHDDGFWLDRKELNMLTLEVLLGFAAAEMRRRKARQEKEKGL